MPVYASASNNAEVPQPFEVPAATDGSVEEVLIMENVFNLINHSKFSQELF